MKAQLLFGPYEPDKPPHLQDGLVDMANAYAGAAGYRPVGQFQAITTALPAAFYGGTAYVTSGGSGTLLAGTSTAIYRYTGGAWSALATGLTVPNRWQFTQFGDLAIAVNGGVTKKIDMVAGTIANVPGAPTALCVATVRDFVVYGQSGGNAAMVQWSGFGNQDSNTPGVNQAGFQPMLTGGYVMGIAGGEYGLIIQRSRVVRMSYTGDPSIPFQFDEISSNIGAICRASIVQSGRNVYFLSDRGFMVCDGNEVRPIGIERVDNSFFAAYPRSTLESMYVAVDPRRNAVAWSMPGLQGLMLIYDSSIDRWSPIRMNAAAIFSGFSSNISIDVLDAIYPSGIDTIPYSLDDPRFAGGDPLFLVVDPTSTIGTLSGSNMAAWFTGPFQEITRGRQSRIRFARPIGDAVSGVTITLSTRARLGDGSEATTRGTLNASGQMPVRAAGRYVATRIDYAAGAVWSYQQGAEFDVSPGAQR